MKSVASILALAASAAAFAPNTNNVRPATQLQESKVSFIAIDSFTKDDMGIYTSDHT